MVAPPVYEGRVLPTLNEDGTRRRVRPKLYEGRTYRGRKWTGYGLIGLFVLLPFIKIGGRPLVLLDVTGRNFTLGGHTFLATDGMLLMLLMLAIFVSILWITAVVGRAWCGWGCPQTVYMELVFRPIERLLEGPPHQQRRLDKEGGGLRRLAKNAIFFVLAVAVANVFLSYFVGVDALGHWMTSPPSQHPEAFVVMAVTCLLVFVDFAYFREQMCTVACPYARLQSALLDKDSLIIGYDEKRGEPRSKGKGKPGDGDCIDCGACVATCPTGIDIRQGLQLECIACAQCVDACDSIMDKIGKPQGLIRYASQASLAGGKSRIIRPRLIAYSAILFALVTALSIALFLRRDVDITVLRGIGAPYVVRPDGIQGQLRIKLENKTGKPQAYPYRLTFVRDGQKLSPESVGAQVITPENPLRVKAMGRQSTSVFVLAPKDAFRRGRLDVLVSVTLPGGGELEVPSTLLGPEN